MNIKRDKDPVYVGSDSSGSLIVYRSVHNQNTVIAMPIGIGLFFVVQTGTITHDRQTVKVIRYTIGNCPSSWRITSEYTPKTRYNLYETYWIDQIVTHNENADPEYLASVLAKRTKRHYGPVLSELDKAVENFVGF